MSRRNVFHWTQVIAPDMYEGARLITPKPTSYERLANRIMDELDKRSFDPNALAYLMTTYPEPIQGPLFAFVVAFLNAWAGKQAIRSEEEGQLVEEAKFVIEKIIEAKANNSL